MYLSRCSFHKNSKSINKFDWIRTKIDTWREKAIEWCQFNRPPHGRFFFVRVSTSNRHFINVLSFLHLVVALHARCEMFANEFQIQHFFTHWHSVLFYTYMNVCNKRQLSNTSGGVENNQILMNLLHFYCLHPSSLSLSLSALDNTTGINICLLNCYRYAPKTTSNF